MNDSVRYNDSVSVGKKYASSMMVEGVEVPIVHQWGHGLKSYPTIRAGMAKIGAKVGEKLLGIPNISEKFFGSETLIVEKFKEVNVPGIGNDAVDILAKKGYDYRQICKKIGAPVMTELHITHAIKHWKPAWLNLMLNEGIDEIFDLVSETNATDYYTNALARVGVGNSSTAAAATDTALIGGSTAFVAQEGGFPNLGTAQRIDFKGSFASGIAEFAWEEFTVDNGSSPNANLQRLVSAKGTKSSGETWTAEIQITGS